MDNNSLYISTNISITPHTVTVDGKVVLEQDGNGDFNIFSRELYKSLNCNYSKFYKMDKLCKLAFIGVELLLKDVKISFPAENTALLLANSGSTIDTDTNFVNTLDKIPSPAIFVYTLPNIAAGELSIRHGWKGENLFLISDAFESEEFNENLQMLFTDSNTEFCISGWIDYLSEKDYKACLWLITKEQNKSYRKLNSAELAEDFKIS
jgi:hypothetical protein